MLVNILACPECHSKLKTENTAFRCGSCSREYPFINVVYITDKCRPSKCKRKCLSACKTGKMQYFPWAKPSKRICILECNGCGDCIKSCSLEAMVAYATPDFLEKPSYGNRQSLNGSQSFGVNNKPLRKPENVFMCGHVAATYDYINSKIEEIKPDFVVDDGCGHNLFAAKYGDNKEILTLDGYLDHHAYKKVDLLANGEKLPLADNSVPMFISNFVLEHVKNPRAYLSEIRRTLKKEGVLIISTPTQYWHLINLFSLYAAFEYLMKIFKSPLGFLKNPWRHFIVNKAHEKEHCLDNSKSKLTMLSEISRWNTNNWRELYIQIGFTVISEKITGNIVSAHHLSVLRKLSNPRKIGAHVTFVLRKT